MTYVHKSNTPGKHCLDRACCRDQGGPSTPKDVHDDDKMGIYLICPMCEGVATERAHRRASHAATGGAAAAHSAQMRATGYRRVEPPSSLYSLYESLKEHYTCL